MARIQVPATSANLGPGFDTLGICLNLFNTFTFTFEDEFRLTGFPEQFDVNNNLVLESYKAVFTQLQQEVIPIHIHAECDIPVSRGLGSSSTCIVAGCTMADAVLGCPLSLLDIATLASQIEGHPDNVAPCVLGGCIASKMCNNDLITLRYPINSAIKFLLLIPNFESETSKARGMLKKEVLLTDATSNIQNSLILLEGLKLADAELIRMGIQDALHVPYRKQNIHDYDSIEELLYSHGACGFTISGSGPTCLAIFIKDIPLKKIKSNLSAYSTKWDAVELSLNTEGTICDY